MGLIFYLGSSSKSNTLSPLNIHHFIFKLLTYIMNQEFSQHAQELLNLFSFLISEGKHADSSPDPQLEERRVCTVELLSRARDKIIFVSIFHPQDSIFLLRLLLSYITNAQLDKVSWAWLTSQHYLQTLEFCRRVATIKTYITMFHLDCGVYVRELVQQFAHQCTPSKYLCNEDQLDLRRAVSIFKNSRCTSSLATKKDLTIFSSNLNHHLKMFSGTYINVVNPNLDSSLADEAYLSLKSMGGCGEGK